MSEAERKSLINQILAFPANTYSREYLEQPHPRTGKPYSVSELSEYLKELQAVAKPAPKTQQVQQSPEVARIQAERLWEVFFSRHPEVADNRAHREFLFERGLSLSDDDMVRLPHLEEAAKLLIAEKTITPRRIPTAAELEQQAVTDSKTFQQAAVQLGFADNEANRRMVATLGSGYSFHDIAQAITNGLRLSPVGEAEQQQRDEQERQNILEEIIGARIVTQQDRIKFESMPLEQLRAEVARIREERRLQNMTGAELRAHIRGQQVDRTEKLPDDYTSAQLLLMLDTDDSGKPWKEGINRFRLLCKRYGWRALEQRMGTYVKPEIAGVVRTLRHEFDTEKV